MSLSIKNRIGEIHPACSYVGMQPIKKVAPPIKSKETRKVYFRPILSPKFPNNSDPKGLIRYVVATIPSVSIKLLPPAGNNCMDKILAIITANKRSYHSISVPTEDAIITNRRLFFFSGLITASFAKSGGVETEAMYAL